MIELTWEEKLALRVTDLRWMREDMPARVKNDAATHDSFLAAEAALQVVAARLGVEVDDGG